MKDLSRSTTHRILDPRVSALALAALRLKLHLEGQPKLPLETKQESSHEA